MMDLIDKAVLFVCCFVLHISNPGLTLWMGVAPVIIAVITACFVGYFDEPKVCAVFVVCYIILSVFLPELTIFLPLVCYDKLMQKYQYFCLLSLIPLILFMQSSSFIVSVMVCVISVLCVMLKYHTVQYINMKAEFIDMRDSMKEMSDKLKKQNSDLLEKQDDEIRIATLNERNRIAREIHDNVGHLLSRSILQVGALLAVNKDENTKENLLVINDTLSQAMNSIRSSVHDLYDESIDLHDQVYELVNKFTFCKLNFDYDIQSNPDKKLKYAFIAIVKEALSNIMKHSNASEASITFREHPALYQLMISDNGAVKGFNMDNGIGLKNITELVETFHGNINISTQNGFQLFISVPKGDLTE